MRISSSGAAEAALLVTAWLCLHGRVHVVSNMALPPLYPLLCLMRPVCPIPEYVEEQQALQQAYDYDADCDAEAAEIAYYEDLLNDE